MPLVAFDFETMPIEPLPEYPPKPIGLSIYVESQEPRYLCWGHMEDNNSTEDEAKALLALYWNNSQFEHIAHNDPFDSLVASVHWGFDLEQRCVANDTMVMAFLCDPHALNYQLKPLAKKHLGMEPEEKDEVADWLKAKGYMKKAAKEIGGLIYLAPGTLVGKYANGDTIRTMELFKFYKGKIEEQGMWEAYRREMTLQPIMLKNTRDGICVDVARLTCDVKMYDDALARIDKLLFQMLGCEPFNINSDAQLADAIDKAHPGLVWAKTATGKRSTSKANMEKTLEGLTGKLLAVMQYRASIHTCVNTFMRPWLIQATHKKGNGRIRCQWNTTRSDDGGARTGRLSSSPNFMNIPTLASHKFAAVLALWEEWLKDEFPALPNVRSYVLPDEGEVLISYDFASQELRVLAHYEDGLLLQAYKDDPTQDLHQFAANTISKLLDIAFPRKHAKTVSFSILYGSGMDALAAGLGTTRDDAIKIKGAYLEVLPGLEKLIRQLKSRAKRNEPLRTWGGRVYYVEPPKFVEGRWRSFDYKLLNYLIQGSSADITKEAIIAYHRRKVHGRFLLTVHDQIVISVKRQYAQAEAQILQSCMESIPLDAPLLADGSYGPNLHDVKDFNAANESQFLFAA